MTRFDHTPKVDAFVALWVASWLVAALLEIGSR